VDSVDAERGKAAMKIECPEKPVWGPLEATVGSRCGEFMFMGRVGTVFLYKHIWTRRYLNLDHGGQAYRYTGEGYVPMQLDEAIDHVFTVKIPSPSGRGQGLP
jgi:hypothetical protein